MTNHIYVYVYVITGPTWEVPMTWLWEGRHTLSSLQVTRIGYLMRNYLEEKQYQDQIFDEILFIRYFYKLCARKAIPAYQDQTFDEKLLIRKAIPGSDI